MLKFFVTFSLMLTLTFLGLFILISIELLGVLK